MSQSWSDTLEHAARAAMVAEYIEPPAARRQVQAEWLIALPVLFVAIALAGWAAIAF